MIAWLKRKYCLIFRHRRGMFIEEYGPSDASFKLRVTVCPRCGGNRKARKIKAKKAAERPDNPNATRYERQE